MPRAIRPSCAPMRASSIRPAAGISSAQGSGATGVFVRDAERGKVMSKKAAEHHRKASEHHTNAARHHGEAAKHHDVGNHEKAAHHGHTARGHAIEARTHSEDAVKAHTEEHGKK